MIKWLTTFLEKRLAKKKHEVYKLRWRKVRLEQIKKQHENNK